MNICWRKVRHEKSGDFDRDASSRTPISENPRNVKSRPPYISSECFSSLFAKALTQSVWGKVMQRESNRSERGSNSFFGKFRLSSIRAVIRVCGTGWNYGIYRPFSWEGLSMGPKN
jgi:hypothetical protein